MDFVAADIEYSGRERLPLHLGLVEVARGEIAARHRLWLRVVGHPLRWLTWRAQIDDGLNRAPVLTAEIYEQAPYIVDAWPRIAAVIGDRPLVFHNAGLDVRALRAGFDAHGAPWPELRYGCTLSLARRVWPELAYRHPLSRGRGPAQGYRIAELADALFPAAQLFTGTYLPCGHDPVEDAEAAAHVALAAARRTDTATLAELSTATGWSLRTLEPDRCQTAAGWVERHTHLPSFPLGMLFDRAAERGAFLEIRQQWRGDPEIFNTGTYPTAADPLPPDYAGPRTRAAGIWGRRRTHAPGYTG